MKLNNAIQPDFSRGRLRNCGEGQDFVSYRDVRKLRRVLDVGEDVAVESVAADKAIAVPEHPQVPHDLERRYPV